MPDSEEETVDRQIVDAFLVGRGKFDELRALQIVVAVKAESIYVLLSAVPAMPF